MTKKTGFTMIELLVVTTIIIILTTIGLVSFNSSSRNTRNAKRKADLETVRQSLVLYRTDNGAYPVDSTFDAMLITIDDYLTVGEIKDPKNVAPFVYTYISTGTTFNICSYLEDSTGNIQYCLDNP